MKICIRSGVVSSRLSRSSVLRSLSLSLSLSLLLPVLGTATSAAAADSLITGPGGAVGGPDVLAEVIRMPPDLKKTTLALPDNVKFIASNVYIRRALAAQAERDGLAADPVTAAALQSARDRVLSDAKLAKMDEAKKPAPIVMDRLARSIYRTETNRFAVAPEVAARHILINGVTPMSRDKANALLVQLKAGANFEALAKENSEDKGSAAKGGDLGSFGKGKMVAAFENAAFALAKPGDLSPVVESQYGFHIIQLISRKDAVTRPYEEVKQDIYTEITNKAIKDGRDAEAQRLLTEANINEEAISQFIKQQ